MVKLTAWRLAQSECSAHETCEVGRRTRRSMIQLAHLPNLLWRPVFLTPEPMFVCIERRKKEGALERGKGGERGERKRQR